MSEQIDYPAGLLNGTVLSSRPWGILELAAGADTLNDPCRPLRNTTRPLPCDTKVRGPSGVVRAARGQPHRGCSFLTHVMLRRIVLQSASEASAPLGCYLYMNFEVISVHQSVCFVPFGAIL
jgi:hypothetical protein